MNIDKPAILDRLRKFDFSGLFTQELGWDFPGANLSVTVQKQAYDLRAVAQKRGVQIFVCPPTAEGRILEYATRRKIEKEVTKRAYEHLLIFVDEPRTTQIWQWVARQPGQPAQFREHPYHPGTQSGEALFHKLSHIYIPLDEEEALDLSGATHKLRDAFDRDKVTKKFYDRFKSEHAAFLGFISGITEQGDREWYASLMLNRLMFVYFLQCKGFLDGHVNYLRDRLQKVQAARGKGKFLTFYRYFLLALFHEGFAKEPKERELDPDLARLLGDVPYLNGGLFDVHELENQDLKPEIPDEAFERLFAFLDDWDWVLDSRPISKQKEINPEVLGYIFEKYINQKQMGAYYTKEDITEYISQNTVIPYLFDAARKDCAVAFEPGSALWRLLKDDPDRYLYAAVKQGVINDKGNVIPLLADIAAGIEDIPQRGGWNKPASEPFGLPTETWREHVARRQRCLEIREQLRAGKVCEINDLITLNLNIRQFAQDAIAACEGPELLRAVWHAVRDITVLDPTCGSGAFLFAALNILEPLYQACLDRMRAFVDDADTKKTGDSAKKYADFRAVLADMERHPSRDYFVLKSIIVRNLYGVDIMEEAVEICKLRLFLKLVAQVDRAAQLEPLPDVDFNIRPGNTLVGYTSIEEIRASHLACYPGLPLTEVEALAVQAKAFAELFARFCKLQTNGGQGKSSAAELSAAKKVLRDEQRRLSDELDRYLAGDYGIDADKPKKVAEYKKWRKSHQPFHWFTEFYGIMQRGGFDVIIGNPPYVATAKVNYLSPSAASLKLPDLYAHVLLRCLSVAYESSRFGMIVPLSLMFSEDFASLRSTLTDSGRAWFSSFDNIPAALFGGVSQRCTIWLGDRSKPRVMVTPMYRWRSISRPQLFAKVAYSETTGQFHIAAGIPRVANRKLGNVVTRAQQFNGRHRAILTTARKSSHRLGFSPSARNFVSVFRAPPPCVDDVSLRSLDASDQASLVLTDVNAVSAAVVAIAGECFFHHWLTWGDGFHVTSGNVSSFVELLECVPDRHLDILSSLGECLLARCNEALVFKRNAGKYVGNFNYRGHAWLTRRADLVLLSGLGLSDDDAIEVFDYVRRVLAINEHAGEKAIPDSLKAKYGPIEPDSSFESMTIAAADALIFEHFTFSESDLQFILSEVAGVRPDAVLA